MRYRVTVRGSEMELRGVVKNNDALLDLAEMLRSGVNVKTSDPAIIASPAEDDFNPFDDFLSEAGEKLPSLVGESNICVALVTENGPDPKFCVELGYMIALNKPIIVVVHGDTEIPEKLRKVADEIVEWKGELSDSGLNEALNRIAEKLAN